MIWEMGQLKRDDLAIQGFWPIRVATPGTYRIDLARYPFETRRPIGAMEARLRVGSVEVSTGLAPSAPAARFTLRLPAGDGRLEGTFVHATGVARGPYYARITRLSD